MEEYSGKYKGNKRQILGNKRPGGDNISVDEENAWMVMASSLIIS